MKNYIHRSGTTRRQPSYAFCSYFFKFSYLSLLGRFMPGNGHWLFPLTDNPAPWLIRSLPSLLAHFKNHLQNEELYQFALDGLIWLVNSGEEEAVQNLVEDNQLQEALLLAVRARTDEKILETLVPERHALVKEVMEKLF